MKKSKIILSWMIACIVLSTLVLGMVGWSYINDKADDYAFCITVFLCFLGYMGSIELYKSYLWAKWDDEYIEMD